MLLRGVAAGLVSLVIGISIMNKYVTMIGGIHTSSIIICWRCVVGQGEIACKNKSDGTIFGTTGTPVLDFALGSTRNLGVVHDEELDQLYYDWYAATEFDQLAAISRQYNKLDLEKHVRIQTFNINKFTVYQPYLKGHNNENTLGVGYISGWVLARFWIDQSLKKSIGR